MQQNQNQSKNLNFLKQAFEIYENKFITVLILTLVFYIPFYLIFFTAGNFINENYTTMHTIMGVELRLSEILTFVLLTVLNFIFSPVLMASMYFIVTDYIKNKTVNFNEILIKVIKLWPFFIVTVIIYYLMIFSSSILFIVTPYIITMFYFHTFIICEGEKNPIKALKNTYSSLKGNFFITFGIILLTSILNLYLTNILFNFINLTNMPNNLIFLMFYNLISTIISAYFYIFLSLWYKNRLNIIELKEAKNED